MISFEQSELRITLDPFATSVQAISTDSGILGPVDFGWEAYRQGRDVFTFGEGMFATTPMHGARRLVFCAYSPLWDGFYVSSMGGAAYTFKHVGVNYVRIAGRAPASERAAAQQPRAGHRGPA